LRIVNNNFGDLIVLVAALECTYESFILGQLDALLLSDTPREVCSFGQAPQTAIWLGSRLLS